MSETKIPDSLVKIPISEETFLSGFYEPSTLLPDPDQPQTNNRRMSCIIMMHGFPNADMHSYDMVFPHISVMMAKHGFSSMRFDFRGCGNSSGTSTDFSLNRGLSDLRKTMDWLRQKYKFSQFILVSAGLSCHIALQAFMPNLVTGMVMLCPNINPLSSSLSWMKGAHEDHEAQKAGTVEKDGQKYGLALVNEVNILNLPPLLEGITCPTLIQYGTDDEHAPAGSIDMLRDYMIRSRLELGVFNKGTHGLEDAPMRKAMMMNIEQFLKKIT